MLPLHHGSKFAGYGPAWQHPVSRLSLSLIATPQVYYTLFIWTIKSLNLLALQCIAGFYEGPHTDYLQPVLRL